MTDLLVQAFRAALRAELETALEARLGPIERALLAAQPAKLESVAAYSKRKGISECTTHRRIKDGTLQVERIGRRVLIIDRPARTDEKIAAMAREARG